MRSAEHSARGRSGTPARSIRWPPGLLVIGVGRATRLLRFLGRPPKTYEGTFRLGIETSTLDADGEVTRQRAVDVTDEAIAPAMAAKVGHVGADARRRSAR